MLLFVLGLAQARRAGALHPGVDRHRLHQRHRGADRAVAGQASCSARSAAMPGRLLRPERRRSRMHIDKFNPYALGLGAGLVRRPAVLGEDGGVPEPDRARGMPWHRGRASRSGRGARSASPPGCRARSSPWSRCRCWPIRRAAGGDDRRPLRRHSAGACRRSSGRRSLGQRAAPVRADGDHRPARRGRVADLRAGRRRHDRRSRATIRTRS